MPLKNLVDITEFVPAKKRITKYFLQIASRVLCFDQMNKVYADVESLSGNEVTKAYLHKHKITYTTDPNQLKNIPEKGGVIIVSNHPTGILDGVIMIDMISKVRPDVKFMGNFLLNRITPLKSFLIEVNPFNSNSKQNITGIKQSLLHVQNGGALVIYPAGSVASIQKNFRITDHKWIPSVMKFIRKTNAPVVPIHLSGKNSFMFHLLGLIHPILRTALLMREFIKKDNSNVDISIGAPIYPVKVNNLSDPCFTNYIRTNLFLLKATSWEKALSKENISAPPTKILESKNQTLIIKEIEHLKKSSLLFQQGPMHVFFAEPKDIKNIIIEIGRLREITFREVGEGTNMEIDTDKYDTYYRQLFIWDDETKRIVGGYRVGMGADIMKQYGKKGFYTYTLFKMSDKMDPILEETLELGRSFIVKDFQRGTTSLLFLWKGILQIFLSNNNYRYMLGPASISSEYSRTSIKLIECYLKRNHFDSKISKWIKPLNPLPKFTISSIHKRVADIHSIEMLDKIVNDLERGQRSIPVLIKKYLQLNGKVLSFNVDHDFNDALDVFILLDCHNVPEAALRMLSKGNTEDVMKRFQS
ncbi:MAG: GNAT family N-acetyltransferase [Bacteroidetes bacterium HGW-Bacteroidetes-19]|nr:MAG: GNAT family N-acetyltransferase [Bacteroidetes bacterium HGW-Bacteroidetes-20]PKP28683.1 MAG: GNAT family N-acetyltransferase [Bacteroidetes bacterium HGW-Bacteroidetes-19]